MSDDEEVQYVKKPRNIHYGSLEETEKSRIAAIQETTTEINVEAEVPPAQTTQIHISNGKKNYLFRFYSTFSYL